MERSRRGAPRCIAARAQREQFKIIAYNLSDKPQRAQMTGWNVAPGRWQLTRGIDTTGDDNSDSHISREQVNFEKTASINLEFPAKQIFIIDMKLIAPGEPVEQRPDIAIGRGDVVWQGNTLNVRLHNLGNRAIAGGQLLLESASGELLAQTAIAAMPAPQPLQAAHQQLALTIPAGSHLPGAQVRAVLNNNTAEITQLNNRLGIADWIKIAK